MADYSVTNVAANQVENAAGDLDNVYDITFTVGAHSGTFNVEVPLNSTDVVAAAAAAIQAVVDQVNSIYAL